jgi:hypothetical protein
MHEIPTYQCHVGSAGWDHADWVGSFYPEDLPAEWRLSYYNTSFTCTWLSYEAWSGQDAATLAQWVDDTLERFRFVLQLRPGGPVAGDAQKLALLAPRTGLLVDESSAHPQLLWLEPNPDLKRLAQRLREIDRSALPAYVISREHDLPAMTKARTLLEVMGF